MSRKEKNPPINPRQVVINTAQSRENTSNFIYRQVSFWMSVAGLVFGAFLYLTVPARDNDTSLQLQQQRIDAQEETIKTLTKTQQNDTQEVKVNIDRLTEQINQQNLAIEKLATIIDERIPKSK